MVATQTKDFNARPFIGGADFGSTILVLQQFHFHWGPDVNSGSDHLINGKAYPLEVLKTRVFLFIILSYLILFNICLFCE